MDIYIEFAILDNMVVNYIVLYLAVLSAKLKTNRLKILIASLVATIIAIFSPFLKDELIVMIAIKILTPSLMILCSLKLKNISKFFKVYLWLITYTFLLGGICTAVLYVIGANVINGFLLEYNSFVPVGLLLLIFVLYSRLMILLVNKFKQNKTINEFLYSVVFNIKSKAFEINGFLDSGNFLIDKKTNLPVLVVSSKVFEQISLEDCREIQYSSVGGTAYKMKIIEPENCKIFNKSSGKEIKANDFVIGVSKSNFTGFDGLLSSKIFI